MTGLQIVGVFIALVIFLGIFTYIAKELGFGEALAIFLGAATLTGLMALAAYLMSGAAG